VIVAMQERSFNYLAPTIVPYSIIMSYKYVPFQSTFEQLLL